ncbi:MAG: DNA methyltransferase [Caldilineaceae bacterium]
MCAKRTTNPTTPVNDYRHTEAKSKLPPDVGAQARFRDRRKPQTYRYDSSLAPELNWDGQNPAREAGEQLIAELAQCSTQIANLSAELAELALGTITPEEQRAIAARQTQIQNLKSKIQNLEEQLRRLSRPFLNWAGKAERLSFAVPSLPLFVHERLSTQAIIEGLKSHTLQPGLGMDYFGDPRRSLVDQVLKPYEHAAGWVNRLILGDSLVVMNSLLNYEALGGQVQMIYIDPPYGVKFGSNFQPFVRKRDVKSGDDEDMTREPEMVQAYRDTWELGLHSYLTYLRDRLMLARELLSPKGSIFVQISDENVHHVRELIDEIFGIENFCALIPFKKTSALGSSQLDVVNDYLLWYARDATSVKYNQLYLPVIDDTYSFTWAQFKDGSERRLTNEERQGKIPIDGRLFRTDNLTSQSGGDASRFLVQFEGKEYRPSSGAFWKTNLKGMEALAKAGRLIGVGQTLAYKRFADDFPVRRITAWWEDTVPSTFAAEKLYVVQTYTKVIERCIHMTTDPGDLVLDPTCGSGTTAFVAEQWGRRWISIDTSRVPLALARQRLLTATFPWYALKDDKRGPIGGFVYLRRQNRKGDEIGGIVPHVTLKSITNNEPPDEEVLVDRPEEVKDVTRVTGPFRIEAMIPTPLDWDKAESDTQSIDTRDATATFTDRMLEVLRRSPVVHVGGNKTVTFKNIRPPAKTLALSAEALVENGEAKPVAFVFGPENGAVSERLVNGALREANMKNYHHLYVVGFAIQPNARVLIENAEAMADVPATYVQATLDLQMGDLLKHMRSSQIFSVAGLPEVEVTKTKDGNYQVQLLGLDVFDPVTMEVDHRRGDDVPAWFLDTDYDGLCFRVHQAFFPRTSAWDNLKRALKGNFHDDVWDHLAGATSEPFSAGEQPQIAVKVIDDRGNELLVVKPLP